ncbi:MAG: PorP/SprF family type IX secretion system membrane protein [Lewinellaceae bacterium]|nr:PorP/SprF family type IX secretion system membrane protein [Lewinellaceae bacterium]HRW75298.1 PorP/SprF family type IX secretion system membrane protein [Saprospiraceae bacterium]
MNSVKSLLRVLLLVLPFQLGAQDLDIHWSQYYNAPFYINPALTGVFSGDQRFTGNYRNQWYNVPVRYETVALAYDQKFYIPGFKTGLFGGGLHLFHDQAGASRLRMLQVALSGSYTQRLAPKYYLTFGAQGSFNNRRYSTDDLTFDAQYNGNQFDPTLDPGETFLNTNFNFGSLGIGLNLHNQHSARTWFDLGGGWFNLNTPKQKFNESAAYRMKPRFTGYLIGGVQATSLIDVMFRGMGMFQGPNYESLAGLGLKFHLNDAKTRELALHVGVDYRFNENDAWAPVVGLDFRQWKVSFSYDLNTSGFREATNLNGGPELCIQYVITTVKPLPMIKSCPVY